MVLYKPILLPTEFKTHRSLCLLNCEVRLVCGVLAQCLQGKPVVLEAEQREGCGCAFGQREYLPLSRMQSTIVCPHHKTYLSLRLIFSKRYSRLIYLCVEYIYSVCSLVLRDICCITASDMRPYPHGVYPWFGQMQCTKIPIWPLQCTSTWHGLELVTCNDHNMPSNHSMLKFIPSWLKDLLQN